MGEEAVDLLGARIDPLSRAEVVAQLESCLRDKRRCLVITANVDQVVNLQKSSALQKAYRKADLVVADGVPLLWGARFLGRPLRGRVAGSDIIFDLCALSHRGGYRIYLLGGRPGVARAAAAVIAREYPAAVIAGCACPPMGFEQDSALVKRTVEEIRAARPDLLLVGLGSPKQEVFLAENWERLGVTVGLGVGIALEFLAGTQRRAPIWMQNAGLEWSWRLSREPSRLWRRYLVKDPRFFWLILRERWSRTRRQQMPV